MIKKSIKYLSCFITFLLFAFIISSCQDGKSYSELLDEENKSVNWYLAQNKVIPEVPADSVFEIGSEAPFYRMNREGSVYMRVINAGNMNNRPVKGQTVYFRFTRESIKALYEGTSIEESNSDNMASSLGGLSLVFGNTVLPSTTEWGEGIQIPLYYLGYDCEVDLIVKSTEGRSGDISQCLPYLYKSLKFFKAEY